MNTKDIQTRSNPSNEFKFWLYGSECGMTFFRSEEDRTKFAEKEIESYLDDEWCEDVLSVCAGVVTHIAQQTNVEHKPTDENELEEANWPHGVDYLCDYALLPIPAKP